MLMLASVETMMRNIPWFAWIPIVAIVAGAATRMVQMNLRHRERIEKIRAGIDPDAGRR